MKNFLFLLFLLSTSVCISQTEIADSLPEKGILLNNNWKFIISFLIIKMTFFSFFYENNQNVVAQESKNIDI